MSTVGSFDRTNHLSELASPLPTQEGVLSPANRRLRTLRNLNTGMGGLKGASPAVTAVNTAGNVTYTAAQVLTGWIVRDCAGASRSDVLPTAALLVAAIAGVAVGDVLDVLFVNGSDAAEVITIGAGSGGAFDAVQIAASRVIPQNATKIVRIRITNVTASSEAYVVSV